MFRFALLEMMGNGEMFTIDGSQLLRRRSSTMSAQWSGKREHMSPENWQCFKGQRERFDAAANDVWGFGVVLCACFSRDAFLWHEPDQALRDAHKLSDALREAFRISRYPQRQQTVLRSLVDLLTNIFVDETHRICMQRVLSHPFFAEVDVEVTPNELCGCAVL